MNCSLKSPVWELKVYVKFRLPVMMYILEGALKNRYKGIDNIKNDITKKIQVLCSVRIILVQIFLPSLEPTCIEF